MKPAYRVVSGQRLFAIRAALLAALLPGWLSGQWLTCGTGQCITAGSVGIGTMDPLANLHSSVGSGNTAAIAGLFYGSTSGTFSTPTGNTASSATLVAGSNWAANCSNCGILNLFSASGSVLWAQSNGYLGIGTASPAGTLDIRASSATNAYTAPADQADVRVLSSNNRPLDGGIIEIGGAWGATGYIKTEAYDGTAGAMTFGTRQSPAAMVMQPAMTIDNMGRVGIGTTDPCAAGNNPPASCELAVAGGIQAYEVLVNTGWSDYVFEPGYRLAPLSEVADYIDANGHLPEIPSAKEVKEKGVSLGEMQAKLLAKIEELTLHMIEAEKENAELRKQVQELGERVGRTERAGGGR